MRVQNMRSDRGNVVANQFHVIDRTNHTFVSYETTIAELHAASAFIKINKDVFRYSRTTSRHFLNWMHEVLTTNKPTRKDVEAWMRWETIPASVNCYNTDIDIILVDERAF